MSRTQANSVRVSVVILQEEDCWSAQCLQFDIAAQAKTLPDLHYELERTLTAHIATSLVLGRTPFEGLDPAPQEYWEMFARSGLRMEGDELPFGPPVDVPLPIPDYRVGERLAA